MAEKLLAKLPVKELKRILRENKVRGYSKYKKDGLIALIRDKVDFMKYLTTLETVKKTVIKQNKKVIEKKQKEDKMTKALENSITKRKDRINNKKEVNMNNFETQLYLH